MARTFRLKWLVRDDSCADGIFVYGIHATNMAETRMSMASILLYLVIYRW